MLYERDSGFFGFRKRYYVDIHTRILYSSILDYFFFYFNFFFSRFIFINPIMFCALLTWFYLRTRIIFIEYNNKIIKMLWLHLFPHHFHIIFYFTLFEIDKIRRKYLIISIKREKKIFLSNKKTTNTRIHGYMDTFRKMGGCYSIL